LPGILGRDGYLARCGWTAGTPIRSLPGITTAVRLDIHFWWNTIVVGLILVASHFYLKERPDFKQD
jgi:hypothetical protein